MIGAVPSIPEHSRSLGKTGRRTGRKVVLAVKTWGSEESIHTWKYLKSHLLQVGCEGTCNSISSSVYAVEQVQPAPRGPDHHAASADCAKPLGSCIAVQLAVPAAHQLGLVYVVQTKDGAYNDELVVVHISKSKDKDKAERWDQGGAVIASLQTALQPYKHDVFDLEVCSCSAAASADLPDRTFVCQQLTHVSEHAMGSVSLNSKGMSAVLVTLRYGQSDSTCCAG
eukprot:GHUV01024609.1.p1 GENE.GHUV01024609.1~~GHUV01024609.1.p1  ORF type:complete len:226 (-),score=40.70 GHUV01024609.1:1135-1812(-)